MRSDVTVLRPFRPHQAVTLADGSRALVMCQTRELVTVLAAGTVLVVNRWDCDPVAGVEYSEEDLRWFRRPVTEVV